MGHWKQIFVFVFKLLWEILRLPEILVFMFSLCGFCLIDKSMHLVIHQGEPDLFFGHVYIASSWVPLI